MSRTGVKTLLHYVLHQFNHVNPLCLVNKNFHVTNVCMMNNRVWWPGILTVTYVYKLDWLIYVAKHAVIGLDINDEAIMYSCESYISYIIINPYTELNFYMSDSYTIGLYYENVSSVLHSDTLRPLWHELKNTDISGKIALLIKHQAELKDLMLKISHCIDG